MPSISPTSVSPVERESFAAVLQSRSPLSLEFVKFRQSSGRVRALLRQSIRSSSSSSTPTSSNQSPLNLVDHARVQILSKTLKKVGEIATSNESQKRSNNFKTFSVSTLAGDLEMNEQETAFLGCHNKGSWRHVFYKVRSELTRLVGSSHNVSLPQTIISFDDGKRRRTQGAQVNLILKTKKASC